MKRFFYLLSAVIAASSVMGQSLDERIQAIIGEMTVEEKIQQLTNETFFTTGDNERLDIPGLDMSDGPHGVRYGGATSFPVGIAMAATWDTALNRQVGRAMGEEFWARGHHQQLGPCIDLCRDPRNGRSPETGGEDPYLAGQMVQAVINGIQTTPVIATIKHFNLVNRQDYRNSSNITISERWLMEHYGYNFRMAVQEGGVMSVMNAYNLINGVHCSENNLLLDTILRQTWGFPYYVVSDWGAVHDTRKAIEAGTDICMGSDDYANYLPGLVSGGTVSQETLDAAVYRVLKTKMTAGMLDFYPLSTWGSINTEEHRELCLQAGRKTLVLLKNEDNILPLDTAAITRIAVVGPSANVAQLDGFGSSMVEVEYAVSPRTGLENVLGTGRVVYARGCDINTDDTTGFQAARDAAAMADVVLFVGGLDDHEEGEGYGYGGDRRSGSVDLPGKQQDLINELAKVNPNLVVVLESGGICAVNGCIDQMKGFIYAFYPGQEGGNAIADALFGFYNPGGKLPVTMPTGDDLMPEWNDNFNDDYGCGYRWYDETGITPQFPFGFGLSYTTFAYSNLTIAESSLNIGEPVQISVDVQNTGGVAGEEVVQLYLSDTLSSVWKPEKELRGFERIYLEPGETKTVNFTLDAESFYYWDEAGGTYTVEAGEYKVLISGSSDSLPLSGNFTLTAGDLYPDLKITHLLTIPRYPLAGQTVHFYALVRNAGAAASPDQVHELSLLVDGEEISTASDHTGGIAPGSMRWIHFNNGTWTPGSTGIYTLQARVDPDQLMDEYIRDNDSLECTIEVYDPHIDPKSSLAYRKHVVTSSDESGELSGDNMTDGNFSSRWSSDFSDAQYFVIDLESYYQLDTLIIYWEDAYGEAYTLEVSMDSTEWTQVADVTGGNGGFDTLAVDAEGRFIRFNGIQRATTHGYSVYEFLAYGTDLGIEQILNGLEIYPENRTIYTDETLQFNAIGRDQYGNTMDISPAWSADGGTITGEGLFSSDSEGEFTITVTAGSYQAEALVQVIQSIESLSDFISEDNMLYPNPAGSELHICSPANPVYEVIVYNVTGEQVMKKECNGTARVDLDTAALKEGIYAVKIRLEKGTRQMLFIRE